MVDISSHQVDEALRSILTSNLHFPGRRAHRNAAWTRTRWPSKSSLILPPLLNDRVLTALKNTHKNLSRRACVHIHTLACTQDRAYLPDPVSVFNFSEELPLKASELIILDIRGCEQVSCNNNSQCLLSVVNTWGQKSNRKLLEKKKERNSLGLSQLSVVLIQ